MRAACATASAVRSDWMLLAVEARIASQLLDRNNAGPCLWRHGTKEPVMTKLIGLSGSLRQGSFNSALLRAAVDQMPDGAELTIGSIRGIPLYDGDVEAAEGVPEPVT